MAIVRLAMLNRTCGMLGRVRDFQIHCMMVATAPNSTVSERLSCEIPSRINRKFSDIVPVIPGNRTFNVDATSASSR